MARQSWRCNPGMRLKLNRALPNFAAARWLNLATSLNYPPYFFILFTEATFTISLSPTTPLFSSILFGSALAFFGEPSHHCRYPSDLLVVATHMDLWSFVQDLDIAMRIAIAALCGLTGVALLWHDRRQGTAVARPVALERKLMRVAAARPSASGRSDVQQMTSDHAYDRLRARISEASERAQRMNSCQQGASRQLDTAEVALRRLIDEISGVMPAGLPSTLIPRRAVPVAAPKIRTLAAA